MIRGQKTTGGCSPTISAPPITNSKVNQVIDDINVIPQELATNVETRFQYQATSREIRGGISTGVYSNWNGASNELYSTPKINQVDYDKNSGGSNISRTDTENGENEIDSDVVHTTNTIIQNNQEYNSNENYIHLKSKVQQGEGTGRRTARHAGNLQQVTTTTTTREVIEVESSEKFSFGVKENDNTTTKDDHSQSGKLDEFNDQGKEMNSRKQQ